MGESTSYSMMGSVLKQSQDREGVRIDAPHGWVINDVHHAWTKNETYHWQTGNIFHMTSGQVFHANLNLAEIHTTTNVLTMHVDMTPLQAHFNQAFTGIQVHYEPDSRIRKYHWHGGHWMNVVNLFETEAHEIELSATKDPKDPATLTPGTMSLKADGELRLESKKHIVLESSQAAKAFLFLGGTDGNAKLDSGNITAVSGSNQALVQGADSTIVLKTGNLELKSGNTFVSLSPGKLVTSGDNTQLKGKVTIGEPAIVGMATAVSLSQFQYDSDKLNVSLKAEIAQLKARLTALGG